MEFTLGNPPWCISARNIQKLIDEVQMRHPDLNAYKVVTTAIQINCVRVI